MASRNVLLSVVVPTDFSEGSQQALERALNLPLGPKSKVTLLHVLPDDIKYLASAVFAHRIMVSNTARMRNVSASTLINEIVNAVPVPNYRHGERR